MQQKYRYKITPGINRKSHLLVFLVVLSLAITTLQLSGSAQKLANESEQELKQNNFANHQHIDINNNKKTVVTFGTHHFKPTNMFIWFKNIKTQGKKALLYYKEKPH